MSGVAETVEAFAHDPRARDPRPRHRFTFNQVLKMVDAGVLAEHANVELIGGELIDMSPENAPHSICKRRFTELLYDRLERSAYEIVVDAPLLLTPRDAPEPDLFVFRRGLHERKLRGDQVELAIEISDTSLRTDLVRKAALYARHGIADYWVLDVAEHRLWIHRAPSQGRYQDVRQVGDEEVVEALRLPAVRFTLRALDLPRG